MSTDNFILVRKINLHLFEILSDLHNSASYFIIKTLSEFTPTQILTQAIAKQQHLSYPCTNTTNITRGLGASQNSYPPKSFLFQNAEEIFITENFFRTKLI